MHINFLCSLDHVPFQGKTVLDSIFGDDIGLLGYRAVPSAQQPHETQEVNEFLEEERVKSEANALMTTNSSLLTILVYYFLSRKVNLMRIPAPSFPTVHYIIARRESLTLDSGVVTIKILGRDNLLFYLNF